MPNLSAPVTYIFAGDGSLASDGLCAFLQTKSNLLLLGETKDGRGAISDIQNQKPDIAVIDAQLSDLGAREIIEAIRARQSNTRIIVLGATSDRSTADDLLAAGADAYIVRNGPSRYLNEAIRYVMDGGKYLCPQLTRLKPVAAAENSPGACCETESRLRAAFDAQSETVVKLEQAMGRAQVAIEALQAKLERLSAPPVDQPVIVSGSRLRNVIRKTSSAAAAAAVLGVLGFQLAGILKPVSAQSIQRGLSAAAVTAAPERLSGWEWENVERARLMLRDKQYASAENLTRRVLNQDPWNTDASRILAGALFHQNRIMESVDVVQSLAVPRILQR